MKTLRKNADGYNYKYTDLAEIHRYCETENITYWQDVQTHENGEDYIVTHLVVDGEEQPAIRGCRVVQATLKGNNNPAQEQGSALTYARRYSLLMALGLCTADDDGNMLSQREGMDKPITKAHIKVLKETAKEHGLKLDPKVFGKETIEELTEGDYGKALNDLAKLNR